MTKIEPLSRYWLRESDDTMRILEEMLDKMDEIIEIVNYLNEENDTSTQTD